MRSFATRFLFHPILQICMLRWYFWAFFLVSKILQLIVLQIGFESDQLFYEKHIKMQVKSLFGPKQLEANSTPTAFSICFSQSSSTSHALY